MGLPLIESVAIAQPRPAPTRLYDYSTNPVRELSAEEAVLTLNRAVNDLDSARSTLRLTGTKAIPLLIERLSNPDLSVRIEAAELIGSIAREDDSVDLNNPYLFKCSVAISPLTEALKSSDPRWKSQAAETIGVLAVAAREKYGVLAFETVDLFSLAIPDLTELSKDTANPMGQVNAVWALQRIAACIHVNSQREK
ncbi:MAG: hypothetical protein ABII22_01420 [Candidatus Micrarchaeota archaeon]